MQSDWQIIPWLGGQSFQKIQPDTTISGSGEYSSANYNFTMQATGIPSFRNGEISTWVKAYPATTAGVDLILRHVGGYYTTLTGYRCDVGVRRDVPYLAATISRVIGGSAFTLATYSSSTLPPDWTQFKFASVDDSPGVRLRASVNSGNGFTELCSAYDLTSGRFLWDGGVQLNTIQRDHRSIINDLEVKQYV